MDSLSYDSCSTSVLTCKITQVPAGASFVRASGPSFLLPIRLVVYPHLISHRDSPKLRPLRDDTIRRRNSGIMDTSVQRISALLVLACAAMHALREKGMYEDHAHKVTQRSNARRLQRKKEYHENYNSKKESTRA